MMPHDSNRTRRVAEMGGDRPRSFTCRPLLALAAALALSAFLSGCAEVRVAQYTKLKEQRDWAGALKVIREEIASPVVQTDSYLANIRIVALGALADYGSAQGFDQRLDDEAVRYYQEGLRYARNDSERQANLHRLLANYYLRSGRKDLAAPLCARLGGPCPEPTASDPKTQARLSQFNTFKDQGDWAAALKTIREEIASPSAEADSHLADIRIIALGALAEYGKARGFDRRLEDEAKRYHQEGLGYARSDDDRQGQLNLLLSGYHLARSTKLREQQDWAAALEAMRAAVAVPGVREPSTLVAVRTVTLSALGDYGRFHGLDPRMDEEATRYHLEALAHAQKDTDEQARVNRALALYYSKTGRNGLALPYLRKDLDHWKKVKNTYQIIAGYDSLASAYGDMGELELEGHYRAQTLTVAKDYFVLGVRPTDGDQWLQYHKMLLKQMDSVARPVDAAELEKLWAVIEPITIRFATPTFPTYLSAAEHFAVAGNTRRANELFAKAEGQWAKERETQPRELQARAAGDRSCTLAAIQVHSQQYASAVGEFDRCAKLRAAAGMKLDDIALQRLRGAAYEGVGDLDRAIDAYRAAIDVAEKVRGSYTVAERAAFFRGIPRRSYWGLVRSLTRRGLAKSDAGDFVAALRASELMRARQLGEILDARAEAELSSESLENLRRRLRPDEVVLAYLLTDTEIVLLALARDRQLGAVIPYDSREFRRQVLAVANDLADPRSDVGVLNGHLAQLGRVLLGPVQGELGGKERIVAIPDGIANAIPFDLLSVQPPGGYRALISDYTVRLAPSLRFIEQAGKPRRERQGEGLFALGDPVYAKGPEIAGLSETDLRAVTRGSQYLKYFDPLPETRTEVEAIARLFGAERVETLFGQKAAESAVKRANLRGFRYVHFATHGIIGGDVPGLGEPALVLAEEPGEDGFLTASEAAQLKLDADLTVLSACKTGTGEHLTGEGVMGMSRAFLVAGSKSVLVSLWSVESKATERLMVAFYRNLRAGQEAPEALRKAKLDMIDAARAAQAASRGTTVVTPGPMPGRREIDESHPFFWAPFILFGG